MIPYRQRLRNMQRDIEEQRYMVIRHWECRLQQIHALIYKQRDRAHVSDDLPSMCSDIPEASDLWTHAPVTHVVGTFVFQPTTTERVNVTTDNNTNTEYSYEENKLLIELYNKYAYIRDAEGRIMFLPNGSPVESRTKIRDVTNMYLEYAHDPNNTSIPLRNDLAIKQHIGVLKKDQKNGRIKSPPLPRFDAL